MEMKTIFSYTIQYKHLFIQMFPEFTIVFSYPYPFYYLDAQIGQNKDFPIF